MLRPGDGGSQLGGADEVLTRVPVVENFSKWHRARRRSSHDTSLPDDKGYCVYVSSGAAPTSVSKLRARIVCFRSAAADADGYIARRD